MSITTLSYTKPCHFNGLEDFAPPELENFTLELVRRLTLRADSFETAVRSQIPIDTDLVPITTSGATESDDRSISTNKDIEEAKVFAMMWNA